MQPVAFQGDLCRRWMMSVVRMIWDSGGNLSRKGTNVTVTTLATGATSPDRSSRISTILCNHVMEGRPLIPCSPGSVKALLRERVVLQLWPTAAGNLKRS